MEFNVKEWRKMYNDVHRMGKLLKDAQPKFIGKQEIVPALAPLSKEEQEDLRDAIEYLLNKSRKYLNNCNIRPKKPLWKYKEDDKRTWASNKAFIYGDLLIVATGEKK